MPNPANPQSWNRYSYVANNPIKFTDPTGHWICEDLDCNGGPNGGNAPDPINSLGNDNDTSEKRDNNLDFTGYLADVLTARTEDLYFVSMQYTLFGTGKWFGLLSLELPGAAWDIKLKMKDISVGIALCTDQNECHYYDYSTPGNIQLGYLVGVLDLNKNIADIAGGLVNTFDVKRGVPDSTYGGCLWCDDPRDQAAVDFGYNLASEYPNGITRDQLAAELGNSPLTTLFQPPPSWWVEPFAASPGPTIYGPNDFDN